MKRLAMLALLAACGQATAPNRTAVFEADANQVTIGMKMKMTEEGTTKADLHADTAVTPPGTNQTQLTGVRLVFSTPSGKDGKLTSRTGQYDPASQEMVARGNVVLIVPGEQGKGTRTITSEELHWDQRGDRVWSEMKTTMVEEGKTLHTDGFTSDTRFQNISGKNASTGSVRVGEGGIRF
ncbi:MAG TPA: LPS export ABC transporter periplasmic protein LptC [Longimicrobium sp.]|jgi:LPS export ABC transporter protein LptC